jgi:hypothetical protein
MQAKRTSILLLSSLLLLLATSAWAAFDDLAVSPRARAMGSATVAVDGDAWSFYNNPALLTWMTDPEVAAATAEPNGGSYNRLSTVGSAYPLPGHWGAVALGLRHYGVDYRGTNLLSEYTISISNGFQLFKDESSGAAFGWTLNLYSLDLGRSIGLAGDGSNGIDPGSAWAAGLDLGGVAEVWDRTKIGFVVKNVNNPTIGDEQEELIQQVAIAFDIRSRPGQEFRVHGGAEFGVLEVLDLRAGLETDPNKLCAGFGVHYRGITVNYAFSTGGGVLESTHQFGLSYRFSGGGE